MPKRSASSSKAANKKSKTAASASAKSDDNDAAANNALPLEQWRVVLTGDFVLKPKATLETALKKRGVAVTGSVSGKTTHLVLGNRSGVNEYGKKTGVGSTKHTQALERGLVIFNESEVWSLLTGAVSVGDLSDQKQAAKLAEPSASASLADKVLFSVQQASGVAAGAKVSLPKLKQELSSRFDYDTNNNTRRKNALTKALAKLVEDGKLEKAGASYQLPQIAVEAPPDVEWTAEDDQDVLEDRIRKLCPEVGRWRGLRVLSTKPASGRATCKACGQIIAKTKGDDNEQQQQQIQVSDDSLFKMCVWPEDHHEGVSRGYIECSYPGHGVIARRKFFLHPECKEHAEERFEAEFQREWSQVRPHEVEARRG